MFRNQNLIGDAYQAVISFSLLLISLFFYSNNSFSQSPPDTDIFLVDLITKEQSLQVGSPVNITNRKGYDNQPSFTPDGKGLLYTSKRDDGQSDIYRYDFARKAANPLTQTPESEFSPIVTPDPKYFSVIRVEKDESQRLWKFPLSGNGEPSVILKDIKPVGYHCWLNADMLALFILGNPHSLYLANVSTGDTTRIEGNIGRSIFKIPGKNSVSFIRKLTFTNWEIKELNLDTKRMSTIIKTLDGSEDFAWTPNGTLLMCQGSVIYQMKPGRDSGWLKLADLSSSGIKQLTRIAVDSRGKKLALVGE